MAGRSHALLGFRQYDSLCDLAQRPGNQLMYIQTMALNPPSVELTRLMLRIERALGAQAHLRILLADANETVTGRRRELRVAKARLKRVQRRPRKEI